MFEAARVVNVSPRRLLHQRPKRKRFGKTFHDDALVPLPLEFAFVAYLPAVLRRERSERLLAGQQGNLFFPRPFCRTVFE